MPKPDMSTKDQDFRRRNLTRIAEKECWGPAKMSRQLGRTPSFWSDVRSGRKSFGEKLARDVEAKLGLQRNALDEPTGEVPLDINPQPDPVPAPPVPELHATLVALGRYVQAAPPADRELLSKLLDAWVRDGGGDRWVCSIKEVLQPDR